MSLKLHISSHPERRLRFAESTRSLIRLNDLPDSPTSPGHVCEALTRGGVPCREALPFDHRDPWCAQHLEEWTHLNSLWLSTHRDAERTVILSPDVAKQKIIKLRQSVDLRQQIRRQFYPHGGDIQDYIKWIAKMETDITQLADSLLSI